MESCSLKDILVQAFINIDFPAQYIATMKTQGVENVGITDFYKAFMAKNGISEKNTKGKNE